MLGMILSGDEDRDRVKSPCGSLNHRQSLRSQRGLCSDWGRARGSGAPPALWVHSGVGEGRGEEESWVYSQTGAIVQNLNPAGLGLSSFAKLSLAVTGK